MQLMAHIGHAYHALRSYNLGRAVRTFQSLPPRHRETSWVLGQLAMAYFSAERFEKVSCLVQWLEYVCMCVCVDTLGS